MILAFPSDQEFRRSIESCLASSGEACHFASTAEEGLAWASAQQTLPTIIVNESARGGQAELICRQIRRHPDCKDAHVVLALDASHPDPAAAVIDSGADDYLVKPIRPSDLQVRLRLAHRQGRPAGGATSAVPSDEERVQENLRASQDRLRVLTDAIPGAVYRYRRAPDGGQAFEFLSRGAQELFEHSAEAIQDDFSLAWGLLLPEEVPEVEASIVESAEKLSPWDKEFRIRVPSGALKWIRGSSKPSRDADGSIVWNGIFADITTHKRLEAELHLAGRLNSVGTLAAGVAHEINNPLAYVLANVEYTLDAIGAWRPHPSEMEEWREVLSALSDALDGTTRMREIVKDLRTFSRADETRLQPTDIHSVLEIAVRITRNQIRHRARLEFKRGAVDQIMGDQSRLAQVFTNLIVNALQAMPSRDPSLNRIEIRTSQTSDRVVVQVSDNGVGIRESLVDRIFDPFFTTRTGDMAAGLGLALCHGIVTSLGGEISVQSSHGEGSTFFVSLPRVISPAARGRDPSGTSTGPRQRILVVDDEPLVLSALQRMLSRDHDVDAALNAREAIRRIEENGSYDLVLCDLMMPGVSGKDLFQEVQRSDPALADRFCFLTGGTFTVGTSEFAESERERVLEKPIDAQRLRALVSRMTRRE